MKDTAWKAEWIWGGEEDSPRNEWRCFRSTFEVTEGAAAAAELRISADSRYVAYVNGVRIGRGPVRSWPEEQFYDSHSIGHLLKSGEENTIAVLVLHFGVTNFYYLRGRGGLLAEVNAGGSVLAATDSSWRTEKLKGQLSSSPRMSCQQGFAEVYDARGWDDSWTESGYDDSLWSRATRVAEVGEGPWKKLIPRDIPFLTEEKLYPSRIESLQRVKPPAWTAAIDLRNAMVPESVEHANHMQYMGYIATNLSLAEAGKVTIGVLQSRGEKLWINGQQIEKSHGVDPEKYYEIELNAGEHFILLDITQHDHGGAFHLVIHSEQSFSLHVPDGGGDTPWIIIGPFDQTVFYDTKENRNVDRQEPNYLRAAGAASIEALAAVKDWIRPLESSYYTEQDVFGSNVWRPEAERYGWSASLNACLTATPEYAIIPRFASGDTELVIDLGKQRSGFFGFKIEAPAGTIVDVYGLEYLKGDFRQHTYGLDNTFRYICREGRQIYESPVRRGFRYAVVTIRGASEPVKLHEVYMVQSTYPVVEAGTFQSSDPLLNDIWTISQHTTRLCMEDTFVDCPAYEQTYWVGDSRNEALVNYYIFGELDIVKRCLRLVPGSKDRSPLYMDQVPSGWTSVIPNWTFFWVLATMEYVEHTGDKAFAAEMWPHVRFTLEHYLTHINEQGLLEMRGWNLLDWAPIDQPNEGIVTHQNLFLAKTLRQAAHMAAEAGEASEGNSFVEASSLLAAAINDHLWDREREAYLDCIHADGRRSDIFSMQTQVVALLCDVAQGERKAKLESYLIQPPASFVQIGSPFMSFFYYEALEAMGRVPVMLDDIRRNYGLMVASDATTCWEMYPNFTENRANADLLTRSHCHAWSAGPAYFLGRNVLGVKRLDHGWNKVSIEPVPCDLKWARGAVPLPNGGVIEVNWSISGDEMSLQISAPEDVELDVRLPAGLTGQVSIVTTKKLPL
ncbi:glycoside hydrolase family 78 protein [Paenibacillus glycanilyticus]|uniref:family 78 glycoside hydrolase catalytic domain n=1 Tax=Paenibacillus glycanilyticus TaxID=126569 RepID=UPI00203B4AC3|nr:family 78 glycoside hydrolase catalytic domain [Paenibacillus glycanilyticus]MCM3629037.1 glycoside hydrolase family 78 protein [Paenibacillus glycanilyticus]